MQLRTGILAPVYVQLRRYLICIVVIILKEIHGFKISDKTVYGCWKLVLMR